MFAPKVDYIVGPRPNALVSADFDGDGDMDLATAPVVSAGAPDGKCWLAVLMNNGDGTFAPPDSLKVGDGINLAVADLDMNGSIDIVAADFFTHQIYILLNNGAGDFVVSDSFASGGFNPRRLCAPDLDGDGDFDLVVPCKTSSTLSIFFNNGDATFSGPVIYSTGGDPHTAISADLDLDGDSDIVVTNHLSGTVSVFLNDGNGAFPSRVDYPVIRPASSPSLADYDGDGCLDLAVGNTSTASQFLSVLLGNCDGTFDTRVDYPGCRPHSVASADYDMDGDIDIAVSNNECNSVSIFLNDGDSTFAPHFTLPVGTGSEFPLAADFDNDGDIDLAASNFDNDGSPGNSISILINWTNDTADADFDGIPDVCDSCTDTDFDGFGNPGFAANTCAEDNCEFVFNPGQENTSGIGPGDACCCVGNKGDANGDGKDANILDLTFLVDYIFRGSGDPGPCPNESDANGDNEIDVSDLPNILDLTFLVDRIFRGGPPPGPCPTSAR